MSHFEIASFDSDRYMQLSRLKQDFATSSQLLDLLDQAIELEGADKGNIQLFLEKEDKLQIIAQRGFDEAFLEHFQVVKAFDSSSCGRALGTGNIISIANIKNDKAFRNHLEIALAAGYQAVKSVPVKNEQMKVLGVLSTHYSQPMEKWNKVNLPPILQTLGQVLHQLSQDL